MSPRSPLRAAMVFLYIWLMIGFFTGTLLLMGPVQWINDLGRSMGWPYLAERIVMLVIMGLLVVVTAYASWKLQRWSSLTATRMQSFVLFGAVTLLAAGAAAAWMNPAVMLGEGDTDMQALTRSDHQFVFGPYPTEESIRSLEEAGFTGIISLLHPAVVPFEPRLIERQRAWLADSTLEFVHAPMLPWVGENTESLDKLRELVATSGGKYYIHCYLGRDRVRMVHRALIQAGASVADLEGEVQDLRDDRRLESREFLERGRIFNLGDAVYLTPALTDEEYMGYVVNQGVQVVVTLRDPDEHRALIEGPQRILPGYGVDFLVKTIPRDPRYEPDVALQVAREVRALSKRPVVVHDFRSEQNAPRAEAFVMAYRSDLPPLPPTSFNTSLANGEVRVYDINRAVGPRPTPGELDSHLFNEGISTILYLGSEHDEELRNLRSVAEDLGMTWYSVPSPASPDFPDMDEGGTWYVFGPGASDLDTSSTERLRQVLTGFQVLDDIDY